MGEFWCDVCHARAGWGIPIYVVVNIVLVDDIVMADCLIMAEGYLLIGCVEAPCIDGTGIGGDDEICGVGC